MYKEREVLILQLDENRGIWKDITTQVVWYKKAGKAYQIRYTSNDKWYWKKESTLKIFNCPQFIELADKIIYCQNTPVYNCNALIKFGDWVKIFFKNNRNAVYKFNEIKITNNLTKREDVKDLINYLKEIARMLSREDKNNEERGFLENQLEELVVSEESVLGKILVDKFNVEVQKKPLIFPFNTNLSQKLAVKRAMEKDLSIIQGPPGTGKTETIRNIIANYIFYGGSVAVLSGNNEAIKNVRDKFIDTGFGYLNAFLGKTDNVKEFFEAEKEKIALDDISTKESLMEKLISTSGKTEIFLQYSLDVVKLAQKIEEYRIEKETNDAEYLAKERNIPKEIEENPYSSFKLLKLASLLETLPKKKVIGFFNRIRMLFKFGITKIKAVADNQGDAIEFLKNKYYVVKIEELQREKEEKETFLEENNLETLQLEERELSLRMFKQALSKRYKNVVNTFSIEDYKYKFKSFLKQYPIVYSTTHAIRACSGKDYLYDCVIIDESSQVDLISAVIAFSVAKKVVLVGDDKQLPHVVKGDIAPLLKSIYDKYKLESCYEYTRHNIMTCILKKYPKVSNTLLNEHYRCDPQIIGFCNKRFYNGELIVRTLHEEGNGVTIITHGAHFEHNRKNQRQIDIIEKEILPTLSKEKTGIIAPYNNQINLLKKYFSEEKCAINTIHKFQGKEKDFIILSTVANQVKFYEDDERIDFLNNPNLINVAISRAKKRLYILASEELLKQEGSLLRDLSKYYEYYCNETKILKTQVYSVFDLMYDDYAPILQEMKKNLLHISEYPSENIIATVISEICKNGECGALACKFNYPLKYIIKSECLQNEEDIQFVNNIHTHCDFLIFNRLDKSIELVVEVDGRQHELQVQEERDRRKDRLLEEAGIKILRLPTTAVDCKEKIIKKLKENR